MKYLKLMRIHHYIKNLLIFLPLFFSMNMFNQKMIVSTLVGFIVFSLLASSIYIFNDIKDKDLDKKNVYKKNRPIASGNISVRNAFIFGAFLLILSLIINYISFGLRSYTWIYLFVYLIINVLYSLGLKNIAILDITILSLGYLIRLLYGGVIIGILISDWLYLTVLTLSFYMSLGKRRNESNLESQKREVLKYYNTNFLDKSMTMCLTMSVIFYSLWTVSKTDIPNLIWGIPIVLIICLKYSLNIEKNKDGDPVEVVLNDKLLLLLILIYAIITFLIIYI